MPEKVGRIRLASYVKDVRKTQWFICSLPLCARLLDKQSALAFPPLGAETGTYVFMTIVLAGVAAVLPWALPTRKFKALLLISSTVLILVAAIGYHSVTQRYVLKFTVPDVSLSIGSVRTSFADQYFSGKSDVYMLQAEGPNENEVKRLWTDESVDSVRSRIFASYLSFFTLLNFIVGLISKGGGAD